MTYMHDPGLIIRKATVKDAYEIARIQVDGWKATYKNIISRAYLDNLAYESKMQKWTEIINNDGNIFIAVIGKEAVGFVDGGRTKVDEAELFAIYVLEKYQEQGIGSKLFQQAKIFYQENDYKNFRLWVLKENPYISFYEKMGGVIADHKMVTIEGQQLEEIMYKFET